MIEVNIAGMSWWYFFRKRPNYVPEASAECFHNFPYGHRKGMEGEENVRVQEEEITILCYGAAMT